MKKNMYAVWSLLATEREAWRRYPSSFDFLDLPGPPQ
jgi:hypothetical protein